MFKASSIHAKVLRQKKKAKPAQGEFGEKNLEMKRCQISFDLIS